MRKILHILILLVLASTMAQAQVYILNVDGEEVSRQEYDTGSLPAADSLYLSVPGLPAGADSLATVSDSLRLVLDSLAHIEALNRQRILDSMLVVARENDAAAIRRATLLRLWQREHVIHVSRRGRSLPNDTVVKADGRVDSLLRIIDEMPADHSLALGQPTLRMPLLPERYIPLEQQMSQRRHQGVTSRFRRQLDFGDERLSNTYDYYRQHLGRARVLRSDIDIPTERFILSREAGLEGRQLDVDNMQSFRIETVNRSLAYADKWHRKGNSSFQMSQTALTDNWYKGGDNNMSLASDNKLVISRYDKNKKTTFETTLRLQLSGYYTKADTIHEMRVSDNLFRVDINYGYKAWKDWYYSTTTYAKTPVFDYYNTNSRVVKSTLLSPLEWNVSVGMDYKKSWNKNKSSYSLLLAPLSYNLTYVHDGRVNEKSYGVDEGKCSKNQFGSSITSKLEWRITGDISLSSRLYYFTDYKSVQAECENTFNFAMSRHFSARLYLYPRFDDKKDEKVQMKEMFTFGFSTIW